MKKSRIISALLLGLSLTACSVMEGTPEAPPVPTAGHAQEIKRTQTGSLTRMGTISVTVYGSPMNVAEMVQKRADASGANYYYIVMMDETVMPGRWYAQAILYK